MMIRPFIVAALCIAPACIAADAPGVPGVVQLCLRDYCGNTPFLDHGFFELDQTGAQFSPVGGYKITAFKNTASKPVTLVVTGFQIKGNGIMGPGLNGYTLQLVSDHGELYEVKLDNWAPMYFYEGRNDGTPLDTYDLTYTKIVNGRRSAPVELCPRDQGVSIQRRSLFWAGDRFDPDSGRIIANGALVGPWFNIACEGDGMWKGGLAGYAEPASHDEYVTTVPERNAEYAAITADYCGVGAMTEPGTAVDWANPQGWLWVDSPGWTMEAVWGDGYARCLGDTPRVFTRDEVETACGHTIPHCDDIEADWQDHGYIATYVP